MNRKLLGGVIAAGLTVATLGALPLGAEANTNATVAKPTAAGVKAKDAGRNLIKSKAPQLKVSAKETFSLVRGVTSSTNDLQYAAYQREYKGLDVYGGDFIVTTNAKGQILSTSVAQTAKIGNLATTPTISKAKASAAAKSKLTVIKEAGSPELVVYALGAKPRLAWQVAVAGSEGAEKHTSVLDVYVDARTGKVIRTNEQLHYANGEGTGFYNGPSPLPLDVALSGSTYSLEDASNGFKCTDMSFNTLTSPDNKFGNGDGTSIETGCADSYYAVQVQDDMLTEWLGRDSFNGSGGSWPLRVGLDDVNAFYCTGQLGCPAGGEQVQIGHRSSGNTWISSMDVVGHEMGHGIDRHTGTGGVSGGKTQEFVADVFGTLTEHYDNQGTDYDEPDYTIGEEANLVGNGPIRVMYKPDTISGHPNCYSSSLPSSVHAAAGPGNHWFYLLAEGSAPAGKPASPTCDGSTVTGIGIEKAGKIFYNGLLQKASNASYPNFRKWTLQAAKNLYPGSCAEFNVVKAAWTAISVPAQTGEATCTTQGNTVTVTNPGNKSGVVGTAATLQMTGSSSGGGALTWTATGLPAGLSINATTGLISGTPTTAGTYNVTVTGKDSTNAQGSTNFTWTITDGTTPPPAVTLANSIALNNCSASLVRYPSSTASDKALMLTNGHCYEGGFIDPGVHLTDRASTRAGTLLKADGTSAGTVTSERLIYATMTGTDVALYRLNETFSALQTRTGGTPYTIAAAKAANGIEITIPSGYHKRIWDCSLNGFTDLRENGWNWKESLRYNAECDTIGGTSGSPIVGDASGEVVGINNTGNESGEMCTLNNPCEVAADGTTTAHQGQSYGQQTYVINTCINSSRQLDLTLTGCKLQGASTPPAGNELQNGVAKTGLSGASSSTQTFTLQVPAGATGLKFVTSGGTGDADMYVKFGSAPTTSSYDCRPYLSGNNETCNIATAQAGTYYVMIRGYSAYSGLSLTGSYTGGGTPTPCAAQTNGTDVAIADNATVESSVTIAGCTGNASATAKVAVNIQHTYIGDLKVDLIAPDGSIYVLHNRSGGSADNINTTYTVNLSSEVSNGTWKLRVNDNATQDTGKIDTWTLTP